MYVCIVSPLCPTHRRHYCQWYLVCGLQFVSQDMTSLGECHSALQKGNERGEKHKENIHWEQCGWEREREIERERERVRDELFIHSCTHTLIDTLKVHPPHTLTHTLMSLRRNNANGLNTASLFFLLRRYILQYTQAWLQVSGEYIQWEYPYIQTQVLHSNTHTHTLTNTNISLSLSVSRARSLSLSLVIIRYNEWDSERVSE